MPFYRPDSFPLSLFIANSLESALCSSAVYNIQAVFAKGTLSRTVILCSCDLCRRKSISLRCWLVRRHSRNRALYELQLHTVWLYSNNDGVILNRQHCASDSTIRGHAIPRL